jgi:hypothetical protein
MLSLATLSAPFGGSWAFLGYRYPRLRFNTVIP